MQEPKQIKAKAMPEKKELIREELRKSGRNLSYENVKAKVPTSKTGTKEKEKVKAKAMPEKKELIREELGKSGRNISYENIKTKVPTSKTGTKEKAMAKSPAKKYGAPMKMKKK